MGKKPLITRREFLAGSVLASAGIELIPGQTAAERESRSIVKPTNKLVGCYTSIEDVLHNPQYIDALQKRLGVNTLICGSAIKIPTWLQIMNPAIVKNTHRDDDSRLLKAIDETHRRGMNFWIYLFANHHYYGEEGRHLMSETFEGINFLDLAL